MLIPNPPELPALFILKGLELPHPRRCFRKPSHSSPQRCHPGTPLNYYLLLLIRCDRFLKQFQFVSKQGGGEQALHSPCDAHQIHLDSFPGGIKYVLSFLQSPFQVAPVIIFYLQCSSFPQSVESVIGLQPGGHQGQRTKANTSLC